MTGKGKKKATYSAPNSPGTAIAPPQDVLDLTFGVELEYCLLRRKSDLEAAASYSDAEESVQVVFRALSEDMQGRCNICRSAVRFRLPLKPHYMNRHYGAWTVVREHTITVGLGDEEAIAATPGGAENYYWHGIEIKSRILHPRRPLVLEDPAADHDHELTPPEEIRAVLAHIKRRFNMFDETGECKSAYLYTSKECGLHVHVGHETDGFELETLKKLMCLSLGCERLIDSLHPTHRIDGSELSTRPIILPGPTAGRRSISQEIFNIPTSVNFLYQTYCRQQDDLRSNLGQLKIHAHMPYPRSHLAIPEVADASKRNDHAAWYTLINHCPDLLTLYNLCQASRSVVVNLQPLTSMNYSKVKRTIEFRQHATTLDAPRVLSWIDLVLKMVRYSVKQDKETVGHLLSTTKLGGPRAHVLELCRAISCIPETLQYYEALLSGGIARKARSREKKSATTHKSDPLAALVLYSVDRERRDLEPRNTRRRIDEKLRYGGYGQLPREVVDAIAPGDLTEQDRQKITIGYKAPVLPVVHPPYASFSEYDSAPADSDGTTSSDDSTSDLGESEEQRGRHPTAAGMALVPRMQRTPSASPDPPFFPPLPPEIVVSDEQTADDTCPTLG